MPTWTTLDSARTASGDEVVLRQRGEIFDIRFNGWELMSNRNFRSEARMAEIVCGAVGEAAPRVLIGGLGMGYTLRAALDAVGPAAEITVCELLAAVVAWNEGVLAPLAGAPLRDGRVTLRRGSVAEALAGTPGRFDAILLDTDNGPDFVVHEPNHALYGAEGLAAIARALAPRGVAGLWSAAASPAFEARLAALGLPWRVERVWLGTPGEEPFHVVYLVGRELGAGAA